MKRSQRNVQVTYITRNTLGRGSHRGEGVVGWYSEYMVEIRLGYGREWKSRLHQTMFKGAFIIYGVKRHEDLEAGISYFLVTNWGLVWWQKDHFEAWRAFLKRPKKLLGPKNRPVKPASEKFFRYFSKSPKNLEPKKDIIFCCKI